MVDPFARHVTYVRVSVTDRCDFRCVYCMSEHMTFLPKTDLLTLEELDRLCSVFIAAGQRRSRRADADELIMAIDEAISRKPKGHDFVIARRTKKPAVARHMSVTGG
jgi:GTP 3',8-cyclase